MLVVQLGYKDKRVLTRYFDELHAKLLAYRKALARSQVAQMRRELQPYTRMEPAPSMAEVCSEAGIEAFDHQSKVPAEYGLIVSRYQQRCRTMPRLRQTGCDCDRSGCRSLENPSPFESWETTLPATHCFH